MKFSLEYHRSVRQSILASLALLGMFLLPLSSSAQISSAGSASSGGHSFSAGTPAMSAGVHSYAPANSAAMFSSSSTHSISNAPHRPAGSQNPPHYPVHRGPNATSHSGGVVYYPYLYAVPVPYAADDTDASNAETQDNDDAEYQGGPTVFDRRGSGPDSYVPPVSEPVARNQSDQDISANISAAEPPQTPTMLVFKNGRQLEVANYAIVGQTLYDLTARHPRKIALSDLDLSATEKENDDRGVAFQLPPTAQAN